MLIVNSSVMVQDLRLNVHMVYKHLRLLFECLNALMDLLADNGSCDFHYKMYSNLANYHINIEHMVEKFNKTPIEINMTEFKDFIHIMYVALEYLNNCHIKDPKLRSNKVFDEFDEQLRYFIKISEKYSSSL